MRTGLLPLAALCFAPACQSPVTKTSDAHGWITRLVVYQGVTYGCSQAGVFVRELDGLRWLYRTDERIHDIALTNRHAHVVIVACGGVPARHGRIVVIDTGGSVVAQRTVGRDLIYAVATSPTRSQAAVACADGRVLVIDLETLEARTVHAHTSAARCVAFAPDGASLVSGGLDGLLRISSLSTTGGERVLDDHTAPVECLAYSQDGRYLASGARDGKIRVHDSGGRLLFNWYGPDQEVRDLVFDAPRIVAAFADGRLAEIDTRDRTGHVLDERGPNPLFAICCVDPTELLAAGSTIAALSTEDRPKSRR